MASNDQNNAGWFAMIPFVLLFGLLAIWLSKTGKADDINNTSEVTSAQDANIKVVERLSSKEKSYLEVGADISPTLPSGVIEPAVGMVRLRHYRCDKVSGALEKPFGKGMTLWCNSNRYRYELTDVGGNWVVSVK